MAVYAALTKPGDTIMSLAQPVGGHSSNRDDGPAAIRGLAIVDVPLDPIELEVDLDEFAAKARRLRPRLVALGASMTLFPFPVRRMAEIVSEWDGRIFFDGAHQLGLIAGGQFQDPLGEGAAVLTGSAGKTVSVKGSESSIRPRLAGQPVACALPGTRRRPMPFSLLYLILRRLLPKGHRPEGERDIEWVVLRHQVKVLRRQVKQIHLRRSDRMLLAAASRTLPRALWSCSSCGPRRCFGGTGNWCAGSGCTKERQVRTAPARRPDDGPHPPLGKGEPPVGVPAHPRRAAQARRSGLGHHGPIGNAPRRPRPGPSSRWPVVVGVPSVPGHEHPGL